MANETRVDEFIRLFTRHEPRLRAYILTLVPRYTDAEEISQQCSLILWKKFNEFQPGTNFFAWSCKIARLQVHEARRKWGRERMLFSGVLIEALADETTSMAGELDDRLRALLQCVEKLPAEQRQLLHLRYMDGGSIETVAQSVSKTVQATYRSLSRIRQVLFECVGRVIARGEA